VAHCDQSTKKEERKCHQQKGEKGAKVAISRRSNASKEKEKEKSTIANISDLL